MPMLAVPAMPIISHHHNGFGIELDDNAPTHAPVWVKAHALANIKFDHGLPGALLIEQLNHGALLAPAVAGKL